MLGCVRVDVAQRDQCGSVSDNPLHHVWVTVICICFIRFVIKVSRSTFRYSVLHLFFPVTGHELGYSQRLKTRLFRKL